MPFCGAMSGRQLCSRLHFLHASLSARQHQSAEAQSAHECRFQLRCVMMQPLELRTGQAVKGSLRLVAHNQQSYDLHLTLTAPPLTQGGPPQQVLPTSNLTAYSGKFSSLERSPPTSFARICEW